MVVSFIDPGAADTYSNDDLASYGDRKSGMGSYPETM
jgi:hypothetical protein